MCCRTHKKLMTSVGILVCFQLLIIFEQNRKYMHHPVRQHTGFTCLCSTVTKSIPFNSFNRTGFNSNNMIDSVSLYHYVGIFTHFSLQCCHSSLMFVGICSCMAL